MRAGFDGVQPVLCGLRQRMQETSAEVHAFIAEVVAEIERQNRRWNKRFSALDGIEDCYEELVQLIAQSEVAVAAAEERRE